MKLSSCALILMFYFNIERIEAITFQKMFTRKIELKSIDVIFSNDSAIKSYVGMRKFNRTHTALNYNCTITKVIDASFRYDLEVQKWSDGGWKKNLITYASRDPCAGIKYTLGKNFEDVMERSGSSKDCPYVPGFYHFDDFCFQATQVPLIYKPGLYRVVNNIYDGPVWNLKLTIVVDIVETSIYSK